MYSPICATAWAGEQLPTVILLAGLPGSGKTTLANRLSVQLGYIVLSRDTIKRALFGAYDVGNVQSDYAFNVLLDTLPISLSLAPGVIIDGVPFAKIEQAERVELVTQMSGAVSVVFFLDCDVEIASDRVELDHTGPSNRSPELVRRVSAEFRDIPDSWFCVDALKTPSEIEDRVLSMLSSREAINNNGSPHLCNR